MNKISESTPSEPSVRVQKNRNISRIMTVVLGALGTLESTHAEPPGIEERLLRSERANANILIEKNETDVKLQDLLSNFDSKFLDSIGIAWNTSKLSHEEKLKILNKISEAIKQSSIISSEEYNELIKWSWMDWETLVALGLLLLMWWIGIGSASTWIIKSTFSKTRMALWAIKKLVQNAPVNDIKRIKTVEYMIQSLYKNILLYKEVKKPLYQCKFWDLCIWKIDGVSRLFEYGWTDWESRFQIWWEIIPTKKLPKDVLFIRELPL